MTSATIKDMLNQLSEEQLFELKKEVEQRLCSIVPERPIVSNSADPMVLFARKYIEEELNDDSTSWIYQRYDTRITFRPNGDTHVYQCDSSIAPIDSYAKFVENLIELKMHCVETDGDAQPFEVTTMKRNEMVDSELIFAAGFSGMKPVQTLNTSVRKPRRFLDTFSNEDEFFENFVTDRKDYVMGNKILCMQIFEIGKYSLYMIDEDQTAIYLIVEDYRIINYFDSVTGGNPIFHLYEDNKVLVLGQSSCTVLNPLW